MSTEGGADGALGTSPSPHSVVAHVGRVSEVYACVLREGDGSGTGNRGSSRRRGG